MAKKVFFDGFNLSLKQGTGVATYTRATANQTRNLGYETGLLFSRPHMLPKSRLASEVVFFDEEPGVGLPRPLELALKGFDYLVGFGGAQTRRVELTGAVLTKPLGSKWVAADHIYTAPNVFDRAAGFLAVFRQHYNISFSLQPDLFHWTYPLPIRARNCPNIYTIHDLVPLRLPYTTLDRKRIYLRTLDTIARKADHIVTVSEHSRRDIIRYLGVDEKRVTNTYESVDIADHYVHQPMDSLADELSGVFGLSPRRYFLFYGSLEPKKNIGRIVHSYLSANVDMPLIMVLSRSWLAEGESQLLNHVQNEDSKREKGARRRILRFDYLPFPLLMTLIRGARGVIFPSLYEGFGLPVLEAMTLGTPVITSNISSLPEVAGEAALMVNPYESDELRSAIIALGNDDDLVIELSRRGTLQAKKFSPDAYRERLGALYSLLT